MGDYSETMLFEEDCFGDLEALTDRLRWIYANPPTRNGAKYPYHHDPDLLASFCSALSVDARPVVAPSDLNRLRILEHKHSAAAVGEAPADLSRRILYRGLPGTGKTFRLLALGFHHAMVGRRVLFACFNKVLAADVGRTFSSSDQLKSAAGELRVHDVFELVVQYARAEGLELPDEEYDDWGEIVVSQLREEPSDMPKFDTVLIDESQDMQDWQLELLELHLDVDSTVCAATGPGQRLYGSSSRWLDRFAGDRETKVVNLRRNFRNTKPVFQVAQTFYEADFEKGSIASVTRRFKKTKSGDQLLLFERKSGQLPLVMRIDDSNPDWGRQGDTFFSESLVEFMSGEYAELIRDQLSRLTDEERPLDLLVLVPSGESKEAVWARQALKKIGASFVDYTLRKNRRLPACASEVRLCTFHSSRGLEGMRVIIFGFEVVQELADQVGVDARNLGYVTLSRSIFETTIVRTESTSSRFPMSYLEAVLRAVGDSG